MSQQPNHFKIGLFVLCAVILVLAGAVLLGAGALLREDFPVETYIDEPVTGLEVGSPVRYKGVRVGVVKEISFVDAYYETDRDYVYVLMSLRPIRMTAGPRGKEIRLEQKKQGPQEVISTEVDNGLRIQLTFQGITGIAYLEANHFEPERYPGLPIDWKPVNPYIPSAQSAYQSFTESADQILRQIESSEIDVVSSRAAQLLSTLDGAVANLRIAELREELDGLLEETRETNDSLQVFLNDPQMRDLPSEVHSTLEMARATLDENRSRLAAVLDGLTSTTREANKAIGAAGEILEEDFFLGAVRDFQRLSAQATTATASIDALAREGRDAMARLDNFLATQETEFAATLEEMRALVSQARSLISDLQDYPSLLIFGEPPPRRDFER